jgi:hypothetical protein
MNSVSRWWTLLVLIVIVAVVSAAASYHHHDVAPEPWAVIRADERAHARTPIYTPVLLDTRSDNVVMITLFLELSDDAPDMLTGCREMLARYPEMACRIVMDRRHAYWQTIPDFARTLECRAYDPTNDHNLYVDESVRTPDDLARFLEHFPAQRIVRKRRPPWQFITFPRYRTGGGGGGGGGDGDNDVKSAVLVTLHHTHFDGLNAMRFLFNCFQRSATASATTRAYDAFLMKFSKPSLHNALLHKAQTFIEDRFTPFGRRDVPHAGLPTPCDADTPQWIRSTLRRRWQPVFFRHALVAERHHPTTKFWWNGSDGGGGGSRTISLSGLKRTVKRVVPRTSLNDVVVMCVAETLERLARRHGYHGTLPLNIRMPVALRSRRDYVNDADTDAIQLVSRAAFIEIPFGIAGGGGGVASSESAAAAASSAHGSLSPSEKLHHIRRELSARIWKPTAYVDAMTNVRVPFNYIDKAVKDMRPVRQRHDALNVFLSNVPGAQSTTDLMGAGIERFVFFTKARANYPIKIQLISYRDTLSLSLNAHPSFRIPIDEVGDALVDELSRYAEAASSSSSPYPYDDTSGDDDSAAAWSGGGEPDDGV